MLIIVFGTLYLLWDLLIFGDVVTASILTLNIATNAILLIFNYKNREQNKTKNPPYYQLSIIVILSIVFVLRLLDPFQLSKGVPRSIRPILTMYGIEPKTSLTYCINGFEWAEFLWKAEFTESDFQILSDGLGFEKISEPYNGAGFEFSSFRLFPHWWDPPRSKYGIIYKYSAPSSLSSYSWQCIIIWDPKNNTCYMHIMDIISYTGSRYAGV